MPETKNTPAKSQWIAFTTKVPPQSSRALWNDATPIPLTAAMQEVFSARSFKSLQRCMFSRLSSASEVPKYLEAFSSIWRCRNNAMIGNSMQANESPKVPTQLAGFLAIDWLRKYEG
eukprot:CAMPEP_0169151772 /NCGR_PEP_ID=MMETSP1015-20121227/51058_1 /TAXON_ID=342587 /ORGANISM="Karlodinium micrum, Strain CCMP2283" /LENGTH=116 /DNA_ID=CAMNT_0009221321 /DNA_START=239 /DNA_END=589 /DNA_ORIENTATION=+